MSDYLHFSQKLELRKLLAPQMRHSLHILALPLLDLVQAVNEEMLTNPVLEEEILSAKDQKIEFKKEANEIKAENLEKIVDSLSPTDSYDDKQSYDSNVDGDALDSKKDYKMSLITKKVTLQDTLLQQLSISCDTDEELAIGHELIGNIDDNGYLRLNLEEICHTFKVTLDEVERILKIIQKFDPIGVAARNIPECLLIQLEALNLKNDLMESIVKFHLEDIANKNYTKIAKALKQPIEIIEESVKKISNLNPKPGRNYSTEESRQIIPDIIIEEFTDEDSEKKSNKNKNDNSAESEESNNELPQKPLRIIINNENIPRLVISKYYRDMLKKGNLDAAAKEYIVNKLKRAYELLQAVTKRQSTLRMVIETIISFQEQAIRRDLSYLKPLTFRHVAEKINMHESTVCRVVMNKYVYAPCGVVALKDFFPSKINSKDASGQDLSSEYARSLIKDIIEAEDKKHPLSDEEIVKALKEKHNLDLARRTVAKYREEMRILSSSRRKIR